MSSVLLGTLGIAAGVVLTKLELIESLRGEIAAWAMIAFGLVYGAWGLRRAMRAGRHQHLHAHESGDSHEHDHDHQSEHVHAHTKDGKVNLTPWVLFTVFVFGPCEPLIPLLMYPAAQVSTIGVAQVAIAFSAATICTMMCVVLAGSYGIQFVPLGKLERFSHALAGAAICLSGVAITFLGL